MRKNLPISDTSHDQQRTSFERFQSLVPKDLFILREESGGDYGNDRILEAKSESKYVTNFRLHVQLKSQKTAKFNPDGTLSYPVEIKTLNYLLNHAPSIYAVYLEDQNQFYWSWTTDILKESQRKGIDTSRTQQQTFSHSFAEIMSSKSFEQIHKAVLTFGYINRQLVEIYSRTATGEQIQASIDLTNGRVTTLDEKIRLLKTGAFALANTGRFEELDRVIATLPSSAREDQKLSLAVSYAKFLSGQFMEAWTWLPRDSQQNDLSEEDRQLVSHLDTVMQYNLRMIGKREFEENIRESRKQYPGTVLSLLLEFEEMRNRMLRSWKRSGPGSLEKLTEVAERIHNHPRCGGALTLQVDVVFWEIEGHRLTFAYWDAALWSITRGRMALPLSADERLDLAGRQRKAFRQWLRAGQSLLKAARSQENQLLFHTAVVAGATVKLSFVAFSRALRYAKGDLSSDKEDEKVLRQLASELEASSRHLVSLNCFELALRAGLLRAEALVGLGDSAAAHREAAELRSAGTKLGNAKFLDQVKSLDTGCDIFSRIRKTVEKLESTPTDDLVLAQSDEEDQRMAERLVERLNLPADRLQNILKDFRWLKQDAVDRHRLCRHLETVQALGHAQSTETLYAVDPERRFQCAKFGHTSKIPSTDRDSLLAAFRKTFCEECQDGSFADADT